MLELRHTPEEADRILMIETDPERLQLEPQTAWSSALDAGAALGAALSVDDWVKYATDSASEVQQTLAEMAVVLRSPPAEAILELARRAGAKAGGPAVRTAMNAELGGIQNVPPIPPGLRTDARARASFEARNENVVLLIFHRAETTYRPLMKCALRLGQLEHGHPQTVPATLGAVLRECKKVLPAADHPKMFDADALHVRNAKAHAGVRYVHSQQVIECADLKTMRRFSEAQLQAVLTGLGERVVPMLTAARYVLLLLDAAAREANKRGA